MNKGRRAGSASRCPRASADLQDVIVGGAVLTAVSAALYNGLKVSTLQMKISLPCPDQLYLLESQHVARITGRMLVHGYVAKHFLYPLEWIDPLLCA